LGWALVVGLAAAAGPLALEVALLLGWDAGALEGEAIGPHAATRPSAAAPAPSLSAWRRLRDAGITAFQGTRSACVQIMPSWTDKDERQYEHIKESSEDRGKSEDRAEEIAARTVNKHRREEGRTPNRRTQGTGNPNRGLESRTRDEVYNQAKELGIQGRSKMSKHELVAAVRDKR
jgi:plasmid stabilization system protein ParE